MSCDFTMCYKIEFILTLKEILMIVCGSLRSCSSYPTIIWQIRVTLFVTYQTLWITSTELTLNEIKTNIVIDARNKQLL
jgi:hypothetical protein